MLCQNLVLIFDMPRQSTSSSSPTQSRASSGEGDLSGNASFSGEFAIFVMLETSSHTQRLLNIINGRKACSMDGRQGPASYCSAQAVDSATTSSPLGSLPSFR